MVSYLASIYLMLICSISSSEDYMLPGFRDFRVIKAFRDRCVVNSLKVFWLCCSSAPGVFLECFVLCVLV